MHNLAVKTGIEFTNESFLQDAITNIKNTKFESRIQARNSNQIQYNRNYTESGWNFRRDWMDTKNTNYFISLYRRIANDIGLIGTVASNASKIPAIQWAIGVGFAYDIWYFSNVADNTEKKIMVQVLFLNQILLQPIIVYSHKTSIRNKVNIMLKNR